MSRKPQMSPGKQYARVTGARIYHKPGKPPRLYIDFENRAGEEASFSTTFGICNDGTFSEKGKNFAHGQLKKMGVDDAGLAALVALIHRSRPQEITVEDSQYRGVKFIDGPAKSGGGDRGFDGPPADYQHTQQGRSPTEDDDLYDNVDDLF